MSDNKTSIPTLRLLPKDVWVAKQRKEREERIYGYIGLGIILILVFFYFNGSFDGIIHSIKENWLKWLFYGIGGIFLLGIIWKHKDAIIGLAILIGIIMLISKFF